MATTFLLLLIPYHVFAANHDYQSPKMSQWQPIKATDNLYFISHVDVDWVEALRFCAHVGAHLASFESRREETQVLALIKQDDKQKHEYWTSGSNALVKGSFIWTSNGIDFKGRYYNFCNNNEYPENKDQCLTASDKKNCWQTRPCDTPNRFICELTVNMYVEDLPN